MIKCAANVIDQTLAFLRLAGERREECVVLWLGRLRSDGVDIVEPYLPLQIARADQFRIPPEGMDMLRQKLRADRLMVAAQVHTHPQEAFHSEADDAWAIVRHEGALSLVVPRFAGDTSRENFLDHTKVYQFSDMATWDEVPETQVAQTCLQIF